MIDLNTMREKTNLKRHFFIIIIFMYLNTVSSGTLFFSLILFSVLFSSRHDPQSNNIYVYEGSTLSNTYVLKT